MLLCVLQVECRLIGSEWFSLGFAELLMFQTQHNGLVQEAACLRLNRDHGNPKLLLLIALSAPFVSYSHFFRQLPENKADVVQYHTPFRTEQMKRSKYCRPDRPCVERNSYCPPYTSRLDTYSRGIYTCFAIDTYMRATIIRQYSRRTERLSTDNNSAKRIA